MDTQYLEFNYVHLKVLRTNDLPVIDIQRIDFEIGWQFNSVEQIFELVHSYSYLKKTKPTNRAVKRRGKEYLPPVPALDGNTN